MNLSNEDLIKVQGGGIAAAMVSAIVRGINSLYTLGQSVGSAIRRLKEGKLCKIS